MKNLFLAGLLLLIIHLKPAVGFNITDSPEINTEWPDSSYLPLLQFSIPTQKTINSITKTGINLEEFRMKKSIVLWENVSYNPYYPNNNDFYLDTVANIYIHIKNQTDANRDYRIKFDLINKISDIQYFNSKGKIEKTTIVPNPFTDPNAVKKYTGKEWMLDLKWNMKCFSVSPNNPTSSASSKQYICIDPPIYFSTSYIPPQQRKVGTSYVTDPEKLCYQLIYMPSLEDLIDIFGSATQFEVISSILSVKDPKTIAYCIKSPTIKKEFDKIAAKEKAKLLAAKLEAEEKAFIQLKIKAVTFYSKEIDNEIKKSPLFAPKDEFESLSAYEERQNKAKEYIFELNNKYALLYKDYIEQKEVERDRKEAEQIETIKNSYSHVDLKIAELGKYDSEKQYFPITFEGMGTIYFNIPLEDAKSFKEHIKDVKVKAEKQLMEDAKSFRYFNIEVTHPVTGMKYVKIASTPLYLDYVSKNSVSTGIPKILASVKFIEPSGNNLLDGNETARFEVTIENSGDGIAQNVVINLTGDIQKGITFEKTKSFTGIAPNQSQNATFEIKADRTIPNSTIQYKFNFTEAGGFNPASVNYTINTQKFKTPLLVLKDVGIKEITGNGNNIIENGEKIEVSAIVQNIGQGEAQNIKAVFDIGDKNILTLSPDKILQSIPLLNSGEYKLLTFDFTVNNVYSGNDLLPIKVVLSEKYNEYGGSFPLKLEMKKVQLAAKSITVKGEYDQKIEIKDVSLTSDVDKNIPETTVKNANRFALIIGNEDYSTYQTGLNSEVNVEFARNDAQVFKQYCEKTLGVAAENITFLPDATAGKMNQALSKMNLLAKNLNGQAELIFYYAGHGLPDENTKEPYLIPVDVSGTNFKEGGIKLSNVYEKLTEYPSQKVSVFIDACFSGGARNQGLLAARAVKMKPKESVLSGNIVVFSASSGEQSSLPYKDKQHGMFTYFLLKKIQETKGDISFTDLAQYVKSQVSLQSVNINSKEQTPVISAGTEKWENWIL